MSSLGSLSLFLQTLKNWSRGRPGNEASSQHKSHSQTTWEQGTTTCNNVFWNAQFLVCKNNYKQLHAIGTSLKVYSSTSKSESGPFIKLWWRLGTGCHYSGRTMTLGGSRGGEKGDAKWWLLLTEQGVASVAPKWIINVSWEYWTCCRVAMFCCIRGVDRNPSLCVAVQLVRLDLMYGGIHCSFLVG